MGKVGAEGAQDPYMQITHANVVMAALPADRSARNPGADKTRRDYIYKVGTSVVVAANAVSDTAHMVPLFLMWDNLRMFCTRLQVLKLWSAERASCSHVLWGQRP